VVLAYHDVDPHPTGPHHVTPAQLRAQVDLLLDLGWQVVPAGWIVDAVRAARSVDGLAAITFDDGYLGVHEHALPYLSGRRLQATIFAIAGDVDQRRRMTDQHLCDAVAHGFWIGSHTREHVSLNRLDDAVLRDELHTSKAELEQRVGTPVDLLAYPYGHFDRRVRDAAEAAGYRGAFSYLNGKVTAADDVMRLPRLTMEQQLTSRRLAYRLARGPEAWPDTQLDKVGAAIR
jgi:peptidoglycan/xylan/chitin deacetylase (PgdA/CDA1 family)